LFEGQPQKIRIGPDVSDSIASAFPFLVRQAFVLLASDRAIVLSLLWRFSLEYQAGARALLFLLLALQYFREN